MVNVEDRSCRLEVSTPSGIADSASWYDMWDMATAIRDMCVSQGMAGEAVALGELSLPFLRTGWLMGGFVLRRR